MDFPTEKYGLEAMLVRAEMRRAGKINKPIGGERWVKQVTRLASGREVHPVACQCSECYRPITNGDRVRWASKGITDGLVEYRVTVIKTADNAPKARKSKWTKRGSSGN